MCCGELIVFVHRSGTIATYFGASAGLFAVFFFGDVPRVRQDILVNIPIVGGLFEKPEIAPEDNVSSGSWVAALFCR